MQDDLTKAQLVNFVEMVAAWVCVAYLPGGARLLKANSRRVLLHRLISFPYADDTFHVMTKT
jgi:hypothetical protein